MDDSEKQKKIDDLLDDITLDIEGQLEVIYGKKMGFVLLIGEPDKDIKQTVAKCTKKGAVLWMLQSTSELCNHTISHNILFGFMTRWVIGLLKNGHTDALQQWMDATNEAVKGIKNLDENVKFGGPKIK